MADLYGQRRGRDVLFGSKGTREVYARDAYDPSEARDPGGKWTGGGGGGGASSPSSEPSSGPSGGGGGKSSGVLAHGPHDAAKWRDEVTAASPIRTLDDLMASTEKNQPLLAKEADRIGDMLGVRFKNPGAKKRGRLEEKLARPGRTPARITDAARGGFIVTSPDMADRLTEQFAKAFPIADEGWVKTPAGYFDRKLMVKFPNGQMGEVQVWEENLLHAKEEEGGHDHYKVWQALPADDHEGQARETATMRAIYKTAIDKMPQDWNAVLGRSGNEPKADSKASGVNS